MENNTQIKDGNDHLKIWSKVEITDPQYTKPLFYGKDGKNVQVLTSINPTYQVKRATEIFGPCGIGWGYKILKEEIIQGPALYKEYPGSGNSTVHSACIELWYKLPETGEIGTVTQFGLTAMAKVLASGEVGFDEDAPKKSVTDGINKCLSLLGFSADIYLNEFEPEPEKNKAGKELAPKDIVFEPTEISKKLDAATTMQELTAIWQSMANVDRAVPANAQAKERAKVRLSK